MVSTKSPITAVTVLFMSFRVTTAGGKYCTEEDVLASTTQQQSTEPAVTFRLTTARGKLDKEEDILVSTTQHQSMVPSVYFIVTTARDKLNNEEGSF